MQGSSLKPAQGLWSKMAWWWLRGTLFIFIALIFILFNSSMSIFYSFLGTVIKLDIMFNLIKVGYST
jgi:hypothetical protein